MSLGNYPPYLSNWRFGSQRIEADNDTLMRQAQMTAHDYMLSAKRDIDEISSDGYAAEHRELVAAYIQTAAMDLGCAIIAVAIQNGADRLARAIAPEQEGE